MTPTAVCPFCALPAERVLFRNDAAVAVRDAQGNESRFAFEGIKENVGLPDRLFRFQIPEGVEVVAG